MDVPASMLETLNLQAAITAELAYQPPYLPPSVFQDAVTPHVEDATKQLTGLFRTGYDIPLAEIVQVPKRRGGLRPVAIVDFTSRILYRALCEALSPDLPAVDRSWSAKRTFEQAPLETDARYVVIAGVRHMDE